MLCKARRNASTYRSAARLVLLIIEGVVLLVALRAGAAPRSSERVTFDFTERPIGSVTAYSWAPNGGTLFYATSDGTVWSVTGPDFATPVRIIKIALPDEQQIKQIVCSPDGRSIAVVSPRLVRSNYVWDTIWLVDINTSQLRDLLPPGAPFGSPGMRALRINNWFPDGRIFFVQHCGTGCVGLHAVQAQGNEAYWDYCDAKGDFYWSPTRKVAVAANEAQAGEAEGPGLVSASDGIAVAKGASYYRDRRECEPVFKGTENFGPSQIRPHFNSWLPDGRTVLYTDESSKGSQLKLWDTVSGVRRTLVAGAERGIVSPDGRYVCFISPDHERIITWQSKRVLLSILDLRTEKVVASKLIPAVDLAEWSPSMSCVALLTKNNELLLARLGAHGIDLQQIKVVGQELSSMELSWSPDGKYLAVRDRPNELLTIFEFFFGPGRATRSLGGAVYRPDEPAAPAASQTPA